MLFLAHLVHIAKFDDNLSMHRGNKVSRSPMWNPQSGPYEEGENDLMDRPC